MVSRLSYWWTPSWSFEFMVFFVPVMSGWFLTRLKQEKDRTSYWWAMSTGFITISSNHNGQILVDYEQRAGNGLKNSIWKLWWFQILLDKTYQLVSNPWPCISFTLPIWSHEPWLPMRWCWRCVNPSDSRWWGLQGLTWVREHCQTLGLHKQTQLETSKFKAWVWPILLCGFRDAFPELVNQSHAVLGYPTSALLPLFLFTKEELLFVLAQRTS